MKNIQLKYTCAAYPPDGINMEHTYLFNVDSVGCFYKELPTSQPVYADIEFIKKGKNTRDFSHGMNCRIT